jgi:hypothetical protein
MITAKRLLLRWQQQLAGVAVVVCTLFLTAAALLALGRHVSAPE